MGSDLTWGVGKQYNIRNRNLKYLQKCPGLHRQLPPSAPCARNLYLQKRPTWLQIELLSTHFALNVHSAVRNLPLLQSMNMNTNYSVQTVMKICSIRRMSALRDK